MAAKERGNTAFVAGDTAGALREYVTGMHHLRALTAMHLQRNGQAFFLDSDLPFVSDPASAVAMARNPLALLTHIQLFPYHGQRFVRSMVEAAAMLFQDTQPLPASTRLPGCSDLPSLVGRFWSQLSAKFLEPVGCVEALSLSDSWWPHDVAPIHVDQDIFNPSL
jgi:hypothetical protein